VDSLLPVAPHAIAIACVLTAGAAVVQGTIGFGFAILTVPVLSLVDPALAPVPQLFIMWVMTFGMFWRERHAVDLSGVAWILVGRLPGAGIGVLLLELADQRMLDVMIAVMVLSAVAVLASGVTVARNRGTQLAAGVTSGTFSLVSSIGGPPLALLYRDARGPTLRASLAAIFTIGLLITVATRLVAGHVAWRDVHVAAFLMPPLLLGLWGSRFFTNRVEGKPLRIGIMALACLAAIGLLGRAFYGGA
jgi:uncharacterized membrane protein YfcA